jgi:hypothetical protein
MSSTCQNISLYATIRPSYQGTGVLQLSTGECVWENFHFLRLCGFALLSWLCLSKVGCEETMLGWWGLAPCRRLLWGILNHGIFVNSVVPCMNQITNMGRKLIKCLLNSQTTKNHHGPIPHYPVTDGPTIEVLTQIEVPRTLIEVPYLNLGTTDDSSY